MSNKEAKRNMFKLVATEQFMKQLDEMCIARGKTKSEMVRSAVEHYYYDKFRKEEFGYAGVRSPGPNGTPLPGEVIKRRSVKSTVDEKLTNFLSMTMEDQTKFIHDTEYISKKMMEDCNYSIRLMTERPDMKCLYYEYKDNPKSCGELPFIGNNSAGVISDLRSFLTEKEKTERLNAGIV